MTPRAANVGFGWWSHDIGGFSGSEVDPAHHTESPQLFLRWLQFAVWSPVFRTHCRYCMQLIWSFGDDWFALMRQTFYLRNALVPYIYTHAVARAYDQGAALLRPMYWAWPEVAQAYDPGLSSAQYLFGDDFICAPVTAAAPGTTTHTPPVPWTTWLPEGQWVDFNQPSAPPRAGPALVEQPYSLAQTPVFVRAGAVVPLRTMASTHLPAASPLVWMIVAGGQHGSGMVIEDDGTTLDYRRHVRAITNLTYTRSSGQLAATATATSGSFAGQPASREHWVLLRGTSALPSTASCNGVALTPGAGAGHMWLQDDADWSWTAANATQAVSRSVILACPAAKITAPVRVAASWASAP